MKISSRSQALVSLSGLFGVEKLEMYDMLSKLIKEYYNYVSNGEGVVGEILQDEEVDDFRSILFSHFPNTVESNENIYMVNELIKELRLR